MYAVLLLSIYSCFFYNKFRALTGNVTEWSGLWDWKLTTWLKICVCVSVISLLFEAYSNLPEFVISETYENILGVEWVV